MPEYEFYAENKWSNNHSIEGDLETNMTVLKDLAPSIKTVRALKRH